jgi:hypothetical protein
VKNGVVSQRAYDRPLDDVKRRVALDILAEVRRTIREQSGDYVRLKVFYPTADKGKKSANEIFVIGLEFGAVEISVSDTGIGISPFSCSLRMILAHCGSTNGSTTIRIVPNTLLTLAQTIRAAGLP